MNYNYSYEMDLEYFAYENSLELCEDDLGDLFVFVDKKNYNKSQVLDMISKSAFHFDIEEYDDFYKVI